MGLDVTAYKGLQRADGITFDYESGEYRDSTGKEAVGNYIFVGKPYDKAVYTYTEKDKFAINYPASTSWWKHLERMCEDHKLPDKAFEAHEHAEWCWTELCVALAAEFVQWRPIAVAYANRMVEDGEWFLKVYDTWHRLYAFASDGGAVRFR